MAELLEELKVRGFVALVSNDAGLAERLRRGPITLYCGFDPSNSSFTVGNLLGIMLLAHFQRAGHRPIVLMGGGTGMVGDPSGKTTQRPLLSVEEIRRNQEMQRAQLGRYLDFDGERALLLNNADWLLELRYVEFLREIGRHFTVNQLLQHETYRERLEGEGLSVIEFNYALLQAYDFLHLYREYGCILQTGGKDQWFNILAGTELIRRAAGGDAFALVTPLLAASSGQKMGKSEQGAVWLDPERTSPFAFYQFWRNAEDADVERFLALYTFLPMDEVRRLGRLEGADLNRTKEILAFEATKITHGVESAEDAQERARALYGGGDKTAAPTTELSAEDVGDGLSVVDALVRAGLAASKQDARRVIEQGGAYVDEERVEGANARLGPEQLTGEGVLLRRGKKDYRRLVVRG
jgi:tyrosyl-tRNA synthetase